MKYPYVIIDNDQKIADAIQISLEEQPDYICTGIAKDEQDALDLILERRPRLVFLEPEVPGIDTVTTKYSLMTELSKYMSRLPEFIVITKTSDYAIEGIRNRIMDYILKPFSKGQINRTLMRFEKDFGLSGDNTLCFKSYGDYRFVDVDEILYLKADNNTTDFIMSNGNKVEAFKTLKHFQNLLPDHFVRIHNSYIINTDYVSRIHFGKAKCAIKNTDDLIPFSKSYKNNVEEIKDSLAKKSLIYI
ncbi:LytTR family two component transcriptional regulator [Aquimarina sp. MAR_2010_214]|uniref:LytR/AlgR family response regulator transcription factor n=1 Tax=Aquimarina sp. MAR_2010_214 TaxID=1250026 RepID=UPI000C70B77A|nr:LytTR family DNA-binding domain-containing protein [Aquimarina sp. MAR_2010_214]PKV51832.1 LytTR family two component transcriptional regulator [Aquimarina sp. MAR_2010_214]